MLGTASKPSLKCKGSESGYLMHFCVHLLQQYSAMDAERHAALLHAGLALEEYLAILEREPATVSDEGIHGLHRAMFRHLSLCPACEIRYTPKHHLWVHMTSRVRALGNPKLQATWIDESGNRTLSKVTAGCHRFTWERMVFLKYGMLLQGGAHGTLAS